MGPIHPRVKKVVGSRLAQAAMTVAYGDSGASSGPTIAGCSISSDKIIVRFNQSLLKAGKVSVKPYDTTVNNSAMYVLVDPSYWCSATSLTETIGNKYGVW